MDAKVSINVGSSVVVVEHKLVTFSGRKHWEVENLGMRVGGEGQEEVLEVRDEPGDSGVIEQVSAVFEHARQPLPTFSHLKREIELSCTCFDFQ